MTTGDERSGAASPDPSHQPPQQPMDETRRNQPRAASDDPLGGYEASGWGEAWDSWSAEERGAETTDQLASTQEWELAEFTKDTGESTLPPDPADDRRLPDPDAEVTTPGGATRVTPHATAWSDERAAASPPRQEPPQTSRRPLAPQANRVEAGMVVADRYRLEEELTRRGGTQSWRAFDQKLSRPVMLHLLSDDPRRTESVLEAARRAASATDSRFLRVLDASTHDDTEHGIGAYIVCEFAPGLSLEQLLASGPLSGLEAAWVVRELADALAPLHAQGLYHQQLNPDTVVLTATGNVKIVGFLTEEAMFPTHDDDPDADLTPEQDDVQSLGRLLYAMLVRRWPAPHSQAGRQHWGLNPAPMDGHGWLTPRQVKAGVSPALDVVCDQVLNPTPRSGAAPLPSAAGLNTALSRVLGTADAAADLEHRVRHPAAVPLEGTASTPLPAVGEGLPSPAARPVAPAPHGGQPAHLDPDAAGPDDIVLEEGPPAPASSRPAPRRWLQVLVGLFLLTLVGSLLAIGINGGGWGAPRSGPPTAGPASPTAGPVAIASARDFDPEADGGNGEEIAKDVGKAIDGNPKTAWVTMRYKNNPKLGGLKPGVGLVLDLGQARTVQRVELTLQGAPTGVQVRVPEDAAATSAPMQSAKQWRVVAEQAASPEKVVLSLKPPVKTRFVLVYLRSLPTIGGQNYRGAIAEVQVVAA